MWSADAREYRFGGQYCKRIDKVLLDLALQTFAWRKSRQRRMCCDHVRKGRGYRAHINRDGSYSKGLRQITPFSRIVRFMKCE